MALMIAACCFRLLTATRHHEIICSRLLLDEIVIQQSRACSAQHRLEMIIMEHRNLSRKVQKYSHLDSLPFGTDNRLIHLFEIVIMSR